MLAYYLHNLDPVIFRIYDNVGPRWYGLAYVLAFVCSYVLLRVLAKTGMRICLWKRLVTLSRAARFSV